MLENIETPKDLKTKYARPGESGNRNQTIHPGNVPNRRSFASNLGVVEMTLALHYVYNSPVDKIIWDVWSSKLHT